MSLKRDMAREQDVGDDVYVGFIRSLFNDPGVVLIGAFCHSLVGLLVYFQTYDPYYLGVAALMGLAGSGRYWSLRRVDATKIVTVEQARAREQEYLGYGAVQGLIVGIFAFSCIYWDAGEFSEMAAASMVWGGAITITGRNYGSAKMVAILTLTSVGLPAVAFLLKGGMYHLIFALLLAPFMLLVVKMATLVRTALFTALTEGKRAVALAERFNRALDTMPQALLMLDAKGQIVVANEGAAVLFNAGDPDLLSGRPVKSLLTDLVDNGDLDMAQAKHVTNQVTHALTEGFDRKVIVNLKDGRHLEMTTRKGENNLGVVLLSDVSARVRSERKVMNLARFDTLTGLPNRTYFNELISDRLKQGDPERQVALAVLDLDDFKAINDSLSHQVGDLLIKSITERLSPMVSEGVTIGRSGGDEFVVYVDLVSDASVIANLLDDLSARLQQPFEIAENRIRVQLSGGAVFARAREADVSELIIKADLALSRAKAQGKNTWRLFQEEMDESFRDRQRLKAELRSAIESRTLRVVFQPVVSMPDLRVVGCEALCRWNHPTIGPVSPVVFIPLAEEMGIISEITAIVLERSCQECASWPEHLSVAVNLSAKDFRDPALVAKIEAALTQSGLAPSRLEIELTESALLDETELVVRHVNGLRDLGVRVALDDFGTGYSSLSYLHRLPLSKVKIDRSFLADILDNPRSLGLLSDVVKLSRRLGLTVTLEGVETFEQLKAISRYVKPDLLQGFLFGSALSSSGIATLSEKKWQFEKPAKPQLSASSRH